jgi:hypothetical protein
MTIFKRYRAGAMILLLAASPAPVLAQATRPATPARPPAPAAPAPQVQGIVFKCPKAGTVIEWKTAAQINERTSLGSEAGDPLTCISKRGFATTESLYGFYNKNVSAQGLVDVRRGFGELFAGQKTEVTVRFDAASTGGGRFTYEDTWKRLGSETLTIAGKPISAIKFERTQLNLTNPFKGSYHAWYDPASGVWVKLKTIQVDRNVPDSDYDVVKITEPAS